MTTFTAPRLSLPRQVFRNILVAAFVCALIGGCAQTSSDYPNMNVISQIEKILTPEEQKKAIADMQAEQAALDRKVAKQVAPK